MRDRAVAAPSDTRGPAQCRRWRYKAHLADGTIVSDGCAIGAENRLERGIRIWPGTQVKEQAISF